MPTARHHAEWLSLIEVSGPFLSLPVLLRVFPQGLDTVTPEKRQLLRLAYEEWEAGQAVLRPDSALHREWVRFVLGDLLDLPPAAVAEGAALPAGLTVAIPQEGETLAPDWAVVGPSPGPSPGVPRLLVTVYPASQDLNKAVAGSRWQASPATRMLELLRATAVPLGLVTNGEHWLLVHAPRAGESGAYTYASWYAGLWLEEPLTLRAFTSLLGVQRWFGVAEADTLPALFAESALHQQEVTDQLGLQVRRAVEILVQDLDRIDKDRQRALLAGIREQELYRGALTVMMRLVFLLFAEEKDLLLLGNPVYDQHYAISTLGAQLREQADRFGEEVLERRHDAWSRLLATFRLVYTGAEHPTLRLRAYGGRLFDPDRYPFLEGRTAGSTWRDTPAEPLPIHNRTVLHLLEALQILAMPTPGGGPAEARRLSFRALDVEQIGHVYESLLDHVAVRAAGPLLGLSGAKGKTPEVPLADLEAARVKGQAALLALLTEETGRSTSALGNALAQQAFEEEDRLRAACDNDSELFARVRPFAGLLRRDSNDYPLVITTGSVYVTHGLDRRSTGTHYTPPSLTESLVQHALDPLVYAGMADGVAPAPQTLRSPRELLALKICDPACGSGAFLVQACRYLADKLMEAWQWLEQAHPGHWVSDAEGTLAAARPPQCSIPPAGEERRLVALRLIAERCLFGVDKNPMAVEMAKLSLWLVTLQKDKPFTFLDHAIRAGDSLLGVMALRQVEGFHPDPGPGQNLVMCMEAFSQALNKRLSLERISDNDLQQVESKARLLEEAEAGLEYARLIADVLISAMLTTAGQRGKALEYRLQDLALADEKGLQAYARDSLTLPQQTIRPFHWPLEFPEVFAEDREGFDAILGNPPFMGGQKITGALGTAYRDYLVRYLANGQRGSADLCAYFFLHAGQLLRKGGMLGMLATNTLAQGDTREVGLDQLVKQGFSIPRAVPSRKWPGEANLEVAHVWLRRGKWNDNFVLDEKPVRGITPFLAVPGAAAGNPHRLAANADKSFQGSIVLGMGFVLTPEEAQALIDKNPRNRDALYPYLNGEDLNSRPDQSPSRWVINFHDWPLNREAAGSWIAANDKQRKEWLKAGVVPVDYPGPVAADYPDLLAIVEEKVRPERDKLADGDATAKDRARRWWQFGRPTMKLYSTIAGMEQILIRTQVSNRHMFVLVRTGIVLDQRLVCTSLCRFQYFCFLQSSIHEVWGLYYGSTLRTDATYTPSTCFETFPFPESTVNLDNIGERYYTHRQQIMQTRQEGLTQTYNRFHDSNETAFDTAQLRALHVEIDQAVAAAYGWQDLDLGHGFHDTRQGLRYTLSETARREVLDRLLKLNFERYEEEVRQGLHNKETKDKTRKSRKAETPAQQSDLGL